MEGWKPSFRQQDSCMHAANGYDNLPPPCCWMAMGSSLLMIVLQSHIQSRARWRRFPPQMTKYLESQSLTVAGSFSPEWYKKEINTNYNLFFSSSSRNRVVIYTCLSIISRLTNTFAASLQQ